jgi:hypothetical protein
VIAPGLVEGKDYKIDNRRSELWSLPDDNKLEWPAGAIALSSDGELPAPITSVIYTLTLSRMICFDSLCIMVTR